MSYSPSNISLGKRPRTPDEEELPWDVIDLEEEPEVGESPTTKVARLPGSMSITAGENGVLPLAPKLKDFLAPGGFSRYRPRPEWYLGRAREYPGNKPQGESTCEKPKSSTKCTLFGKDWDHALHVAVRENATEAALVLLDCGVPVDVQNAKRFTPLILAAQKGNLFLVHELIRRGADPLITTLTGVSAVLQAAHFGRTQVLKLLLLLGSPQLIEMANYNNTTPLMRASQEGHLGTVKLLLEAGAHVNRPNREHLTALMLASQRGHAQVCQVLIDHGAELDAQTHQNSTSLLLACKRGHVDVVRVLVTAGCELAVKDSRGRTVRDIAMRRDQKELVQLLDPSVQIDLMQRQGRRRRNFEMIRIWNLLQKGRANVIVTEDHATATIHDLSVMLQRQHFIPYPYTARSTMALLRTMTLPEPLVESIAKFLPLPFLWEKRIGMLAKRGTINPDDSVSCALDLIDEILEEGGFLQACDAASVVPPLNFPSWATWKAWGRQRGGAAAEEWGPERLDLTTATCPPPRNLEHPTFVELRRHAGFLQILSRRSPLLERMLTRPPFNMSQSLLDKLIKVSDVASLTRRMRSRGVHFDVAVALDLVMLASQLCSWYWRERNETV